MTNGGTEAIMQPNCGLYPPALFDATVWEIKLVNMAEIGLPKSRLKKLRKLSKDKATRRKKHENRIRHQ